MIRIEIAGTPYTIKWTGPNPVGRYGGWIITANQRPTDHFLRSYFVRVTEDGKPAACTCPAFTFRSSPEKTCKHVDAITALTNLQLLEARAERGLI